MLKAILWEMRKMENMESRMSRMDERLDCIEKSVKELAVSMGCASKATEEASIEERSRARPVSR